MLCPLSFLHYLSSSFILPFPSSPFFLSSFLFLLLFPSSFSLFLFFPLSLPFFFLFPFFLPLSFPLLFPPFYKYFPRERFWAHPWLPCYATVMDPFLHSAKWVNAFKNRLDKYRNKSHFSWNLTCLVSKTTAFMLPEYQSTNMTYKRWRYQFLLYFAQL